MNSTNAHKSTSNKQFNPKTTGVSIVESYLSSGHLPGNATIVYCDNWPGETLMSVVKRSSFSDGFILNCTKPCTSSKCIRSKGINQDEHAEYLLRFLWKHKIERNKRVNKPLILLRLNP